jgi:hypothetical protein
LGQQDAASPRAGRRIHPFVEESVGTPGLKAGQFDPRGADRPVAGDGLDEPAIYREKAKEVAPAGE